MRSPGARVVGVVVVGVLGVLSWGVGSAGAADGQWYIDDYQIREFHDQGLTGAGVTVAVIDSKINLAAPALQGVDIWVQEPSACVVDGVAQSAMSDDPALAFHGTDVVAMLAGSGQSSTGGAGVLGIAPDVKVLYYYAGPLGFGAGSATGDEAECEATSAELEQVGGLSGQDWVVSKAIMDATDQGADIISLSIAGGVLADQALAYAYQHDVIVLAGIANAESVDRADDGWLVPLNGVIGVGAIGDGGTPQLDYTGNPNTSKYVDVVAPGLDVLVLGDATAWGERIASGTSFATPVTAGNLALAIQKYPNATHNQIIQSLIRNTGTEAHELYWDDLIGFGVVDTISLLAADPTQYEDVNPLFDMSPDAFPGPKAADVFGTDPSLDPSPSPTADEPDPSPSPDTPNPNTDDTTGKVIIILAAAGAVLLLLVAIGITATIIHRKRNQGSPGGKP